MSVAVADDKCANQHSVPTRITIVLIDKLNIFHFPIRVYQCRQDIFCFLTGFSLSFSPLDQDNVTVLNRILLSLGSNAPFVTGLAEAVIPQEQFCGNNFGPKKSLLEVPVNLPRQFEGREGSSDGTADTITTPTTATTGGGCLWLVVVSVTKEIGFCRLRSLRWNSRSRITQGK